MNKNEEFNKILKDIKEIKIQGARNIAKMAYYAYNLIPTKNSKNKLLNSRPTEPMMHNILDMAENKNGSGVISRIAKQEKIPVYIVADSWKFTKNKIPIEQRNLNEVWDKAPKNIKIKNPAFEFVDKKYISGVVSELGVMGYSDFVRKMK